MNRMKKLTCALLALSLTLALTACGGSGSSDTLKIGISQYAQHPSLDNCRIGFLQGLEQAGYAEGENLEVLYENAGSDDNVAAQIGQNFSAANVALMVAVATPSAMACYAAAEDKDIPVIFTAISDPEAAHLDSGNITGTSDRLPIAAQLELIRALQPEAKTIGIIYTTSEPNSVSAIAEYEAQAPAFGFTIDAVGVTAQAEVTQAVDTLIAHQVDCFTNLTDNNTVDVLPAILEKTNEAGIPIYGSEIEQVKMGCVASAGIDYVALGIQTGLMAAKVLSGEAACEELPYETVTDYELYVNADALAAMALTIPETLTDRVQEVSAN